MKFQAVFPRHKAEVRRSVHGPHFTLPIANPQLSRFSKSPVNFALIEFLKIIIWKLACLQNNPLCQINFIQTYAVSAFTAGIQVKSHSNAFNLLSGRLPEIA